MKRILGIVAEYDPFHNGHARHLRLARERVQPDFTYVVLSGCFKQRGEMAMLSPYDRAECALAGGADAVFLLPTEWTVRDAEHYAIGAISLLSALGMTHLAFGAESRELLHLKRAAEQTESPSEEFRTRLKKLLAEGCGYPRAVESAMREIDPEAASAMAQPNNILAICYLRAIYRVRPEIIPCAISRDGDYHTESIESENPSAMAVRKALARGDYAHAFGAVPEGSARIIRRAFLNQIIPDERRTDSILIRQLRKMDRTEIAGLPDVSEGLEDRIFQAAQKVNTRRELLNAVCTRRYPRARISRICAAAMLGWRKETLDMLPLPRETLLLGMRSDSEMTSYWRESGIRICRNRKELSPDPAWSLWCQGSGLREEWSYRQQVRKG